MGKRHGWVGVGVGEGEGVCVVVHVLARVCVFVGACRACCATLMGCPCHLMPVSAVPTTCALRPPVCVCLFCLLVSFACCLPPYPLTSPPSTPVNIPHHLQPPQVQFFHTLSCLPDGAQVVMLLGEIDCREGLLVAVQKGKVRGVCVWGGEEGREGRAGLRRKRGGRLVGWRGWKAWRLERVG